MVKQILTTVFMCGVILITSPNIANANNVTVGNDNEQLKAVVKDFFDVSIGSLAAEEERLMPRLKSDETKPNPITHQTAWCTVT